MAGLDFSAGSMNWDQLEKNLGADVKGGTKKDYRDDRFWKLSRDENDNGGALIRLLPDPNGVSFIQRYSHAFQSFDNVNKKKRWYINNSPETIGEPCPASELWSKLYNLGTEESKLEARNFGRKIKFMANIKVIKDPSNPQNEGKIFLWEFGPKLKDKFMQALKPSEADIAMGEEPKELFNPLTGNNFKLKIKKAAGFLNYDDSTIENQSSIYPDAESAKKDIIENAYVLEEFKSPEAFETYEELKGKLKYVGECYTPKNMDEVTFRNVFNSVIGSSEITPVAPVAQPTPAETVSEPAPVQEAQPAQPAQPAQTEQTEQETTPAPAAQPAQQTSGADDLSFLDSL